MNEEKPMPATQAVEIYGQSETLAYTRVISTRAVTFVCSVCEKEFTQMRYPSRLPLYCSDLCRGIRAQQRNEERVRKQRENRRREREARKLERASRQAE